MEVGRGHEQWRWWAGSSLGDKNILERSTRSVVPFTYPLGFLLPAPGLTTVVSVPNLSWAPASRMQQGSLLRSLLGCAVAGEGGGEAHLWILSPFLPGMLCVSWRVRPSMTPSALLGLAI